MLQDIVEIKKQGISATVRNKLNPLEQIARCDRNALPFCECMNFYTLNLKRITSPSCTTYSLPSMPTSPFSRAAAREPCSRRSL